MPCMYNGQPVKGNKGSCPYGSTWVEDTPQAPVDNRSLGQKGIDLVKNNPLEAASFAALGVPLVGAPLSAGIRGAGLLYKGAKMSGRMGKLMDKIFRKPGGTVFKPPVAGGGILTGGQKFKPQMFNQTTKGGLPVQPKFNAYNAPYNKTAGRVMRRPSLMGASGLGLAGAGTAGLYASGADERAASANAFQEQQQQQASNAINANTKALMDANAAEAEKKRVASLNPMERMMENLKTPGFLNESMSGAKGDTRLNRLGQLMSYYGSTPKQRATMKNPMDRFAAIEKGVMDNETALAKAQATLKSQYGKPTVNNLADGMFDLVKDAYGGTWLPFDDKSDDELKRISSLAAVRLTEISQDPAYMGIGEEQLRVEAVRQVGEELGL